ncbi:MAG: TatD family hydrolase [Eubacteriaceae bacterium]|nr:TatD family hydrolase [Eubacteriaceae bacterium]
MLFDTHAHLTNNAFVNDRDELIKQIGLAGMKVLNCGYDEKSSYLSLVLAKRHDFLYAACGMHPHDSKDYTEGFEAKLIDWLSHEKSVALGEIGLDYHYDYSPRDVQRKVFERQLAIGAEMAMPIVVHSREASKDTYDIITTILPKSGKLVLHSFSQSTGMLERYLAFSDNIYFSISGPVTFSNAGSLRETVKHIPLDRLLIETDCPYLTPHPHRGKRNNPLYVEHVAEKISEIFGLETSKIADITAANALGFFQIG